MTDENVFKGVNWSEAPEWAEYWTCDQDGGYWWDRLPSYLHRPAIWNIGGPYPQEYERASTFDFVKSGLRAEESLVKRPGKRVTGQSSQTGGFSENGPRRGGNPSNHEDNVV